MIKKHIIIGTLGSKDNVDIAAYSNDAVTLFPLILSESTLNFGIADALSDLNENNLFPTEVGIDLLVLAAHVYAADTRISRDTESQDTWTREITLIVPVSNIALWNSTKSLIAKLLNFLTGDIWSIVFRSRPSGFTNLAKPSPKQAKLPSFDILSLFSGGLDSLIGAIDLLKTGKTPLLVSHAGDGATSDAQTKCFDVLKTEFKANSFTRLRMWLNIKEEVFGDVPSENTTRGRSFLFFALGIFAGTGMKKPFTLLAPENGLIALNVPLDPLRLGALSTRTTHPFYMNCWNELIVLLNIEGKIENPYHYKTKGEMIAGCADQKLLSGIISDSLSCSSPAKARWQGRGIEHCGYCLPCIIRRASINASLGPNNDPTTYTVQDLITNVLDTNKAEGQQIRSFQFAIHRLKTKPSLAKMLIHKPGPLPSDEQSLIQLADVYKRGMLEVDKLLVGVKTQPL